ncbi:GNAT family N-acetyltransferase [Bacillus seohaeanensis]|uniref:GNAT family N-acetyltransferase n=1 Tax=Bacillus seohaeanensis TaxID=284580 RepID=A0ABW5RM19_9BACI
MNVVIARNEQQKQDAFTVRKVVFVDEQNVPMEEEIDEYEKDSTHFVLYSQKEPVGAGRFRLVDEVGKVERICVHSSQRGKGAGREIMLAIEEYAKNQSVPALKLNAQTHAIPFYEGLGYKIISGEFLDAGIPHKTMKKNI